MTAIVSIETVLLVLLLVLVAGLLRSNAEILRRLGPATEGDQPGVRPPSAGPRRRTGEPAPALAGESPTGDAVSLSFEGESAVPTLLAFLTSGCSTCAGFWETLSADRLPPGVDVVIVTHGVEREQPARLRQLAPERIPVVMSSAAWDAYQVPGAPYFVLVEGTVQGEGVATTWHALSSLVADAIADQRLANEQGFAERPAAGAASSVEDAFAAAGIGPDHPSLYPAGRDGE